MIAPPKGEKRCVEKIETEYGGKACLLVDMVRCSVVVDTEEQLISVAKALGGGAIRTAGGDVYEVVRLKNRFAEPLFNGYRDALYSVRVQIAPGVWHVCEMQLHLAAVIAHKEHTHVYYEFFRSHFGGNMSAADDKMKQLLEIGESGATTLEEHYRKIAVEGHQAQLSTNVAFLKQVKILQIFTGMGIVPVSVRSCAMRAEFSPGRRIPAPDALTVARMEVVAVMMAAMVMVMTF